MTAGSVLLQTSRGSYCLSLVEHSGPPSGPWILTLSMEHAGGLEKFAFRCLLGQPLIRTAGLNAPSAACARLASWLERDFEAVREAALKSIRSERRLAEFNLDESIP